MVKCWCIQYTHVYRRTYPEYIEPTSNWSITFMLYPWIYIDTFLVIESVKYVVIFLFRILGVIICFFDSTTNR